MPFDAGGARLRYAATTGSQGPATSCPSSARRRPVGKVLLCRAFDLGSGRIHPQLARRTGFRPRNRICYVQPMPQLSKSERVATGELNQPLSPRRILRQPFWLLRNLAPMPVELRRPMVYFQGVALWVRVRQQGFTMLGCRRARTLYRLAAEVERSAIPGALVDCGVWNGGSTAMMAAAASTRPVWAFDSFEGLPTPDERDGPDALTWEASCVGREENVAEALRRFARSDRLRIVKGWFDESLPAYASAVGPIALLHADGDWYESVRATLDNMYEGVSPGGYVVVDDYNVWSGARQAVDEFRKERHITAPLLQAEASAYWKKPSDPN